MEISESIQLINKSIQAQMNLKSRPRNTKGDPGGLVELLDDKPTVVIGDLHANLDYLKHILASDRNMEKLKNREINLVILGDAIHNDQTGHMRDMHGSMLMLDYLFQLISDHPDNLIYLRGNHDTFDERLVKSGIHQGLECRKYLLKHKNEEYVNSVNAFFECLPMFVIGKGFVITHAGPIRRGVTRQELIDIAFDRDKYWQLMWNRVHEFRGTPSTKEYDEADIKACLTKLNMEPESYFIVGHNPLWNTGDKTGVWMNVIGIKNHHIIYSGSGSRAPFFVIDKGILELKFAIEAKKDKLYV